MVEEQSTRNAAQRNSAAGGAAAVKAGAVLAPEWFRSAERLLRKIKKAFVVKHTLTSFQQAERLVSVDPLGGCKPMKLLATTVS
jgi:hypothetical protein